MTSFSKKLISALIICFSLSGLMAQKQYQFQSVPGDPIQARIYTLENGLKVYMSVNKEEPKIQTFITVRVGSKNDPAETTGLAHYFEHMMFKGTPNFGTLDWPKEKVMIDEIERLFELYRNETNPDQRKAIYKRIDSVSYQASKLAIPNEYDKMLKLIGSTGTNAATSYDFTYYVENIPSNQMENWAKIQVDRFTQPVLRLFHTELETVYEEKNMSLTQDSRKVREAMLQALFPNHPYGKQTVLGDAEHLKNPSMKNIREFFDKYYVPNNMAIILSGDFDPDQTIALLDTYFGKLKSKEIPPFTFPSEQPINEAVIKTVKGLEAENLLLAYRFPGAASEDILLLNMLSMMLYNGKAGLIDLNLNQLQKVYSAAAYSQSMADYSALTLTVRPKAGQSLDEAKDLLLQQIELIKSGSFPDWMLEAAINNLKLREMKQFESNSGRAYSLMNAYINGLDWEKQVHYIDDLSKITKKDIVAFANARLGNNYVVVYKKQDKPDDLPKVEKPAITPVELNRDSESAFFKEIANSKVQEIEPVFVDLKKAIKMGKSKSGLEILYVPNTTNNTFNLYYYFEMGKFNDILLSIAVNYLPYLGTSKMTAAEIQQEFYKLACSFGISTSDNESYISVSGISDNFEKALTLVEELLTDPVPNEEALKNLVSDMLKARKDAKSNQNGNFSALVDYATYGENSPGKYRLSEAELKELTAEVLIDRIKDLCTFKHKVLFYGSPDINRVIAAVDQIHKSPKKWLAAPQEVTFEPLETNENKVCFAHYDANQSYLQMVMKSVKYDQKLSPDVRLYNAYFGGGMNAIVFQEMREKRSLAYTASSVFRTPSEPDDCFMNTAFIATQNDKVVDAFDAFNELFNSIPLSEKAFSLAKSSIENSIRTQRITKMTLIWVYLDNLKMGIKGNPYQVMFEKLPSMTLQDVEKFNAQYLKDKTKTYIILGRESDMDFNALEKYGEVRKMRQEEIFGY